MTEIPRPAQESTPREPTPQPIPVFSGAEVNEDGTFVNPVHQTLSDLWEDEINRRKLPGDLKRIPTTKEDKTKVSLRVVPMTYRDERFLEIIRNDIEEAVNEWARRGKPPYQDIKAFRRIYMYGPKNG